MRCLEREKKCPHFYVQVWLLFVFECQILDSHPGMAFAKWLACLDEEPFSFEVLFA